MNRREFAGALASMLWAVPPLAHGQAAGRIFRIGWLRESVLPLSGTFWTAMAELGWIDGKNVVVESRYAQVQEQLHPLARELVALKVDLIMTDGTPATRAAQAASTTIPIVFAIGADPVKMGFVASLARPDGNLTGFTFGTYFAKQLEVLKEALPKTSRVAYPSRDEDLGVLHAAAALDLQLQVVPVRGPDDLGRFFAAARSARAQAILFPNTAWAGPYEPRIAADAIKERMPLVATWPSFARSGALLSYGPKPNVYWRRLAAQVDKIFRGAKPSEIAVEQPTEFDFLINAKTEKTLGLTIPHSLRVRAEIVR